ncbi:MAG: hypothetical protein JSS20_14045, partial [Proteobacteria bacterium]|nr:hypothetical protein [Pseudomonadota bacterium]
LMMLAVLLYPLRKSWRRLHRLGAMRSWFAAHMMLGVVGPTLVVLHSNFSLRSTNATVAMMVMLTVVVSGLVGRYVYGQIHIGLSGPRADVDELLADIGMMREAFSGELETTAHLNTQLKFYEDWAESFRKSRLGGLKALIFMGVQGKPQQRQLKSEAMALLAARALRDGWDAGLLQRRSKTLEAGLATYFRSIRRVTTLHFFNRVFHLWHVLHMPLYLLLILVTIGHIVAVHLY